MNAPLSVSNPRSNLFFLIGFMGSGKSMISKAAGQDLGFTTIEMDDEIEALAGMSINEIFAKKGELYFRDLERNVLLGLVKKYKAGSKPVLISTGGGAPCHFDNMAVMNESGTTVFIDLSADRLATRLELKKHDRPLIREKSSSEIRSYVRQTLEKRYPFYNQATIRLNPIYDDKELNIELFKDLLNAIITVEEV